jgi:hypothetical protein
MAGEINCYSSRWVNSPFRVHFGIECHLAPPVVTGVTAAFQSWDHTAFTSVCEGPSAEGKRCKEEKIMRKYASAVRPVLAFLAVAILSLAPTMASAKSVRDSEEVSRFLAEAKTEALQLQRSTEEMNSFAHFRMSWQSEAAKIAEVKLHFNKLGELVRKMNDAEAPSPWQQRAIGEVTPMVEELGSYITMTIYHLDENQDRFVFTSFPEYVAANASLASDVARLISGYVEYGEAKQAVEELSLDLGLPRS